MTSNKRWSSPRSPASRHHQSDIHRIEASQTQLGSVKGHQTGGRRGGWESQTVGRERVLRLRVPGSQSYVPAIQTSGVTVFCQVLPHAAKPYWNPIVLGGACRLSTVNRDVYVRSTELSGRRGGHCVCYIQLSKQPHLTEEPKKGRALAHSLMPLVENYC